MYKKLLSAFTIILITGILITGFFSMKITRNRYYTHIENQLHTNANIVSEYASKENSSMENIDINQIEPFLEHSNQRITFIDLKGDVIFDSQESVENMENHIDRIEVQEALLGRQGRSIRYSETLGLDMMYYAIPYRIDNEIVGVLRLAVELNEINAINQEYFYNILSISSLGLLAIFVLGYRYLYHTMQPIKELTFKIKEISRGSFQHKITDIPSNELGDLARSFNDMTRRMERLILALKVQNAKLETIVHNMKDGIIAVDNNKKVILINPAAKSILGLPEKQQVTERNILEIFRNREIYENIESLLQINKENSIEIDLGYPEKKILNISTNPIKYLDKHERITGVMIIFRDITELRRLENLRKDFVANVSHELKTPITSIKGFVDTLKNNNVDDPAMRKRFLDIIDFESIRLIHLVEDILTLSHLEKDKSSISNEKIDLKDIFNEIILIMTPLAAKKNIFLKLDIENSLPKLNTSKDKFKQMIINIIDNAIKYTSEGGEVKIKVLKVQENIVIKIIDNGIGIPKEEVPRLFERFYRVDKGRSRKAGGTGLGLAIVKHIAHSLNATIDVESQLGKGTCFILHIPYDTTI